MASGILGQSNPAASTNTTVYTVPASVTASFTISVVNTGGIPVTVTVAISATGTPGAAEYIEYQTQLPPNGVLERSGIVAQASKNIVVNCSTANCSVSVYGFEQ
jgi:hypothetical protein